MRSSDGERRLRRSDRRMRSANLDTNPPPGVERTSLLPCAGNAGHIGYGDRPYAMRVTALVITFHHRPLVAAAPEGALGRQAGRDYELPVGQCRSTDCARKIVLHHGMRIAGGEYHRAPRRPLPRMGGEIPELRNFGPELRCPSRGNAGGGIERGVLWRAFARMTSRIALAAGLPARTPAVSP